MKNQFYIASILGLLSTITLAVVLYLVYSFPKSIELWNARNDTLSLFQ